MTRSNPVSDRAYISNTRAITQSAIPDSEVFDDWSDNKLTNRDSFSATAYQFSSLAGDTTGTRPEWQYQEVSGYLRAENQQLEYNWDGDSPVTYVGMDNPFDESNMDLSKWYAEVMAPAEGGSTSVVWDILKSDPTTRGGSESIEVTYDIRDDNISLSGDGVSTTISGSETMDFGTFYGMLVTIENGDWHFYFDPDDPSDPISSELVGTSSVSALPDMSTGGMGWTTSHAGGGRVVRRMEVF